MPTQLFSHLRAIAPDYDLYLFDQWGVIHNGTQPYPDVSETLSTLHALSDKIMLVLSNSSKPASFSRQLMQQMKLDPTLWDAIITSGEHCLECLRTRPAGFYANLGRRYYGIHWPEGYALPDNLDYSRVETLAEADFILLTGMSAALVDYAPLLAEAQKRELPMICANPDLYSPEGGTIKECPGLIVEQYQNGGGFVMSHGKPSQKLYELILAQYNVSPRRTLAIGDSLPHDILGANRAGIDSLFLTQGVHHAEWQSLIHQGNTPIEATRILCECHGVDCQFVGQTLRW